MLHNCLICNQKTVLERAIRGGSRVTEYACENCNIVWYIDTDKKMKINISSTHSKASKLRDEDFEELIKRIADYEKRS